MKGLTLRYLVSGSNSRLFMQVINETSLIKVIAEWGKHEAKGRHGALSDIDIDDECACANHALLSRTHLISRILSLEPTTVLEIDIDFNDRSALVIFNGKTIDDWIGIQKQADNSNFKFYQSLLNNKELSDGYVVLSAKHQKSGKLAPLIIWDGVHRTSAWYKQCQLGNVSSLRCYLILTKQ